MSKKITYVSAHGQTVETTSGAELRGVLILFAPILVIVGGIVWFATPAGADIGFLVMTTLLWSAICLVMVPVVVLTIIRWDAIGKWYRDFVIAKDGWYPITMVVIGILYVVAFAAFLMLGRPS